MGGGGMDRSSREQKPPLLQVDNVPFGIPVSLLEGPSFFKDMLEDSVIDNTSGDGNEPSKVHIRLDVASEVSAREMECFVRLLEKR
ncbi:hypothetical protein FRB99_000237, partial [Tulasnella sp. 403]